MGFGGCADKSQSCKGRYVIESGLKDWPEFFDESESSGRFSIRPHGLAITWPITGISHAR